MRDDALAVDASIAVKWVVEEADSDRARQLWVDILASGRRCVVPPHFAGEVTSALHQRTRRTDPAIYLPPADAEIALRNFLGYRVEPVVAPDLYEQAFRFAQANRLPSIYDCLYVVQAQLLDLEFWTADQRLLAAVSGIAGWVRNIADYPLPPHRRPLQ